MSYNNNCIIIITINRYSMYYEANTSTYLSTFNDVMIRNSSTDIMNLIRTLRFHCSPCIPITSYRAFWALVFADTGILTVVQKQTSTNKVVDETVCQSVCQFGTTSFIHFIIFATLQRPRQFNSTLWKHFCCGIPQHIKFNVLYTVHEPVCVNLRLTNRCLAPPLRVKLSKKPQNPEL